jgi:DNA primase
MNNALNEIKDRLSIEDLVGQYVQLKKIGRNYKGLCPFHSEKTPSFIVSPEKQIAYCFGCNRGGDVFKFLQEVEGVDFVDAMKILAEKTGVKLEKYESAQKVNVTEKEDFYSMYDKAALFYSDNLWKTANGEKVLNYLRQRGLAEDTIKLFRIGYAPDSFDETNQFLIKQGYTKKQLVVAGLVISKETTMSNVYDRFRGRLMFPIYDHLGRIVAFGGRALSKEQDPKYLNSPESSIYHKSKVLYGFNFSKPFIRESKDAVIVEGYMDAMMCFQTGVKNVVAPCGTALVSGQVRLLKPFIESITLSFDTDLAGQEAIKRSFEVIQEFDLTTYVVEVPEGKDPADYAKNHPEKFTDLYMSKKNYGEALYQRLLKNYGTEGLQAKKRIITEFLPFFNKLKSNVEKDSYIRKLASDLDIDEVTIYDEIKNVKLPDYHPARSFGGLNSPLNENEKKSAEELLLGFLIEYPRLGKIKIKSIDSDAFSEDLKAIYKGLLDQYNNFDSGTGEGIIGLLPQEIKEKAALLSLYVSEKYNEVSEEFVDKEIDALYGRIRKQVRSTKVQNLKKQLLESEQAGNKEMGEKLMKELSNLYREIGY